VKCDFANQKQRRVRSSRDNERESSRMSGSSAGGGGGGGGRRISALLITKESAQALSRAQHREKRAVIQHTNLLSSCQSFRDRNHHIIGDHFLEEDRLVAEHDSSFLLRVLQCVDTLRQRKSERERVVREWTRSGKQKYQ
jgi:hypothetical protein